jgi:general secretion pathway protein L
MLQRLSIVPTSSPPDDPAGLVERFGRWWLEEFLNLFPERTAEWLVRRGRKMLILVPERDHATLQLLSSIRQELGSSRVSHGEPLAAAIDRFLKTHRLRRKDVDIGIRLAPEKFFERSIALPLEAAGSLVAAVLQDLKARTPFRIDDVYHSHMSRRVGSEGRILARQWIIRKDIVVDVLSHLGLRPDDVTFVEPGNQTAPAIRIAMRPGQDYAHRSWPRKAAWTLLVSTVLLATTSAAATYWRQQSQIDELASLVAASRSKAQKVRSEIDQLEQQQGTLSRLRQKRTSSPTLLKIWEEITRVLPSHSWLTELRVSEIGPKQEQQVTITGLSAAASTLVGLVTQSPVLFDASLTAPISVDPVEGRERFVLQAKVKQSKADGKLP